MYAATFISNNPTSMFIVNIQYEAQWAGQCRVGNGYADFSKEGKCDEQGQQACDQEMPPQLVPDHASPRDP